MTHVVACWNERHHCVTTNDWPVFSEHTLILKKHFWWLVHISDGDNGQGALHKHIQCFSFLILVHWNIKKKRGGGGLALYWVAALEDCFYINRVIRKGQNQGTDFSTVLSLSPTVCCSSLEKFLEGSVDCHHRQSSTKQYPTVGPVSFSLDVSIQWISLPHPPFLFLSPGTSHTLSLLHQ